ncbi:NAD(P)-dependent dehydrogenase, short-chain alcohol dehydrogenase family [Sinosporangium album]|uniref:NAD(P)-dependent dehydrogenase, short-chain alcohol dehydrogenase family n=1 Tax=Sinosporangium album TaxID=504805 RepID=A0A1G8B7G1_9ACTN|nr:SDR family oxidoreductase [Sinosporangium album]SDH29095.1 NAD(P)-dependent dehydrogenase, short-chain alcohol dehydrogenase family [Sinosporangium album]
MGGRRVVVTGASSGIGLALTRRLLAAGENVVAVDRAACPERAVETLIADLADAAALGRALSALTGPVHALANVAGVPGTAPAELVLAVNVLGARLVTEALRPRMGAGASIVNVASVAAHRNVLGEPAVDALLAVADRAGLADWLARHPLTGPQAYDTSKAAVVRWTRALAGRWVGSGVRVTSVSPGPVETPILEDFRSTMGSRRIDHAAEIVGRHGDTDEVAAVVAFLLGPDASWVNGVDIPVEGGLLAARAARETVTADGVMATSRWRDG